MTASVPVPLLPRPEWIKARAPLGAGYERLRDLMRELDLHTVCEEARCPNVGECWNHGTATFMILGDVCTRACGFCAVKTGLPGRPPDPQEPRRVADAVARMGLRHAVITSVNRDDQPDGGRLDLRGGRSRDPGPPAGVRRGGAHPRPQGGLGSPGYRARVPARRPEPQHGDGAAPLPPRAPGRQLRALARAACDARKEAGLLHQERDHGRPGRGMGRGAGYHPCDPVPRAPTSSPSGQYLRPSPSHLPIVRYYTPDEFARLRAFALDLGYAHVESGPLVRSSYHAEEHVPAR